MSELNCSHKQVFTEHLASYSMGWGQGTEQIRQKFLLPLSWGTWGHTTQMLWKKPETHNTLVSSISQDEEVQCEPKTALMQRGSG